MSRPTMEAISSFSVSWAVGDSRTLLPSRSTTTRVASSKISSSLWLTNIRVTPWDWSRRTRSNSFFTSGRDRVAVGSSRMSSLAFTATAFTISTICCSATDRSMTLS